MPYVLYLSLIVQFIFGLVGATASVLIAYVLPAAIFLSASSRPALLGAQDPDGLNGSYSSQGVPPLHHPHLVLAPTRTNPNYEFGLECAI